MRLKGEMIWITGASSGIGEHFALELLRRGANCAMTARRADLLEQIAAKAKGLPGRAISAPGDVTNLEEMKKVEAQIRADFGKIDILIANAGTHLPTDPLKFNSQEYLELMALNYGGLLHCIEAVLPDMLRRKAGYLVGMASLTGYRGLPRAAAYGASKAAIINFMESLRFYMERQGISVTIINPGFVRTPLTDKNDFKMPFLTEPAVAARIMCDGLERRKKEISYPIPFNWFAKFMRVIPYPLYEALWRRAWAQMDYK